MEDRNALITMWYLRYRRPLMICSYLTSTSVNLPSRDLFRNQWRSVTFPASPPPSSGPVTSCQSLPKSLTGSFFRMVTSLNPVFWLPSFFFFRFVSFRWDADARAFFFEDPAHSTSGISPADDLRLGHVWTFGDRVGEYGAAYWSGNLELSKYRETLFFFNALAYHTYIHTYIDGNSLDL